jgi:hypothetical protein
MSKKQPPFKTEAQEAACWAKSQNLIADRFEQAKAAGKLGKGTVARVALERAGARLRGIEAKRKLLEAEGDPLTSAQAAKLLKISRQDVDKRRRENKLLGLELGKIGIPLSFLAVRSAGRGTGSHCSWRARSMGKAQFLSQPERHAGRSYSADGSSRRKGQSLRQCRCRGLLWRTGRIDREAPAVSGRISRRTHDPLFSQ